MPAAVAREHFTYLADFRRRDLFRLALARLNLSSVSALDLGCGVGILGALCLEAGAAQVVGIDDGLVFNVAADVLKAEARGRSTSVLFARSEHITLSQTFDLVICDHVGFFGFDYGIVALLQDARRRFLKPGGRLIPAALDICIAAVTAPDMRRTVDASLSPETPQALRLLHRYAVNRKHSTDLPPDAVLGGPAVLGRIDFYAENPDTFSWAASLPIQRDGLLDGLAGWFDCLLSPNVRMTNSPLDPGRIDRSQAFLPIAEPLPLTAGDTVHAQVVVRHAEQLISWTVRHEPSGRRFRHSTFDGMIVSEADIRRRRPDSQPRPTALAGARAAILAYCDGNRSRREIEAAVIADHPDLFPTREAIVRFVADVLDRDTE